MTVQKQPETELSEKDKKLLDSYGITETTKIVFFVRTPKMLFWLSVLTLNVYDVYWFYKNWQAVQKVSTKKISPFWRSIFTLFYIWPLLRLMSLQAKARGMQKSYDPVRLAVMYLLVSYLGLVLSRSPSAFGETASWFGLLATCPLAAWVLLLMQRAAAFNNGKVDKSSAPSGVLPAQLKLGKVEKVIVIISAIFLVLATIGYTLPPTSPAAPAASQSTVDAAKQRVDDLTAQYKTCSDSLNSRHDSVDPNDQAAVDAYNADFDACDAVRVQQNNAADDYNSLIHAQ